MVPGRLTLSASHDLALVAVRDALANAGLVQLDVQFRGSIDSIDAMVADRCELAGFHVDGHGGADLVAPYRQRLHAHRHAIIRFAERRQGLMLPRGNPLGIRALSDLPGGPRLVNRQPDFGHATAVRPAAARRRRSSADSHRRLRPGGIHASRRRGDRRRRPGRRRLRHRSRRRAISARFRAACHRAILPRAAPRSPAATRACSRSIDYLAQRGLPRADRFAARAIVQRTPAPSPIGRRGPAGIAAGGIRSRRTGQAQS